MPFDAKKINGPETSQSYKLFTKPREEESCQKNVTSNEDFALKLDVSSKAKGSCYIEEGANKVHCAVFELRETSRTTRYADKGDLHVDFRYAPFSREFRNTVGENEEKLLASSIKTALASAVDFLEFPHYQVDVFILVLEQGEESVLSTAITAAGMALINASIPCYDVITSSETSVRADTKSSLSLSSLASIDQVSHILFNGFIDPKAIKELKSDLHKQNSKRSLYLKKVLQESLSA